MIVKRMDIISYHTLDGFGQPATLMIFPRFDSKPEDFPKAYEEEARELASFLHKIFCLKTIDKLKLLL